MWETVKLGDVVSFEKVNGKDSGLPYVGMENISSETMQLVGDVEIPESTSSTFIFDDSHVLYGRLRPYLKKVLLPDFKGQCSTEIFCLKPNEALLRGYLAYWLLNPIVASTIEKTSTGARMPRANMNAILNFAITLPPLAEQQRIVAKLDAAFAEIDRAIESSKETLCHVDALVVRIIETTLHGTKNHQAVKVVDVADMLSGYAFKSSDYTENTTDTPLLRGDNIAPNHIDLSSAKRLPIKFAGEYKRFELKEDDVILAMDRPYISTGLRLAKINESHLPCLLVQRVMRLRAKPKLNPDFLQLAMETPRFLEHILGNQTGLGVPHISGKTIGSFEFELPDLEQQARIASDTKMAKTQIKKLKHSHERRVEELTTLKAAILAQELQPSQSEAA